MFRFAYANQNNAAASAMCAEAASSCTSQSSRFNCIALGAIIMASIIISRLISIIGISLLVLVLLVVLMGVPAESVSSKMYLVRHRQNARRSSVPQWRLPEESMSAALMSTR